jgi:hypothetical protein
MTRALISRCENDMASTSQPPSPSPQPWRISYRGRPGSTARAGSAARASAWARDNDAASGAGAPFLSFPSRRRPPAEAAPQGTRWCHGPPGRAMDRQPPNDDRAIATGRRRRRKPLVFASFFTPSWWPRRPCTCTCIYTATFCKTSR